MDAQMVSSYLRCSEARAERMPAKKLTPDELAAVERNFVAEYRGIGKRIMACGV